MLTHGRRRLGAAALALAFVFGCGAVDAPRWEVGDAPETPATSFATPRRIHTVAPDADIGFVARNGTVVSTTRTRVDAPANGTVSGTRFARGEFVDAGQVVLSFLPEPNPAEQLELQIAELEVERRIAAGAGDDAIAEARQELDDLVSEFAARAVEVPAPVSGAIGTTRPDATYLVEAGDRLFEIRDPAALAVELRIPVNELNLLSEGADVLITPDDGALVTGTIAEIPDPADASGGTLPVRIDLPAGHGLVLDDGVDVSIVLGGGPGVWVPLEFFNRRVEGSYVLVEESSGRLRRVDGPFGLQTSTHIEVRDGIRIGERVVAPG